MGEMPGEHSIGDLLAHADWLRGLAARLVQDGDADDAVQDTWVAAIRSPLARGAGQARSWLAQVMRNFARRRWRRDAARRTREQAEADANAAAPSAEELLERAQLQRALADLVLALDEPFRSTVLLRYFEGKSAADISGRSACLPERSAGA